MLRNSLTVREIDFHTIYFFKYLTVIDHKFKICKIE